MKFIYIIMLLVVWTVSSCSKEKKTTKMIDLQYIRDDGTLDSCRLFQKEIEKEAKKLRKRNLKTMENFKK